jgi:tetratricopeptide (TPR) repeat protein
MIEPRSAAIGKHRRFRWLILIGLLGVAAIGAVLLIRAQVFPRSPQWVDIQRAAAAGRSAEVDALLDRWVIVHPNDDKARMMLARNRLRQNRKGAVAEVLRPIPESSSAWAEAQTILGELAFGDHQAALAEQIFRKLSDHDSKALEPRQRLIYLFSLQQRTAEARDILWQMYHIRDDPRILLDLVLELLADQDDVRGLGPEIEQFLAATPADPFVRRAWGIGLLHQGRATEALAHLEAAAGQLENDPLGRFALAECRILVGQPAEIEKVFDSIPDGSSDAAQWWLLRGRIEESTGQAERAVGSFERTVALQPESREAHFRLGQTLKRLARDDAARIHLDRASQIDLRQKNVRREHQALRKAGLPSDPALYERLGDLCAEIGMVAESRAWLEQSLKLLPDGTSASVKLARLKRGPETLPFALARPRLASKSVVNAETHRDSIATKTRAHGASTPASSAPPAPFVDRAAQAGVNYRYDSGASDRFFIADTMGGGVGLFDYDGDGWLDIYFVNGCVIPFDTNAPPQPNRLYRNQGDGTFRDVTARAGVAGQGYGMGCSVADYDNDGDLDLLVTGLERTILYRNRGDGTFEDVTASSGVATDRWTTAAGFGDFDGDGDLDLALITYVGIKQDDTLLCRDYSGRRIHCTPGRYAASPDLLYRNNGDGTFSELSHSAGFEGPDGRGLGLAIADFDADGKIDIFVANDASRNFLFRNLGGFRFEETGEKAGVAFNGSGRATASMGVVAEDLDGDARIDLFITNLVNESSTFFHNLGGGLFVDATLGAGLDAPSRPKTGFGVAALDADADGRLDLFVANGHVDDRPWANSRMAQTALFFWGSNGRFVVADKPTSSYFVRAFVGRGVAAGDLNNDGRTDLVVVHRDAPAALLYNEASSGHWLGLKLSGTHSGKTAIGARVSVRTRDRSLVRWWTAGTGYLSSHEPAIWIGLAAATKIDQIEVKWPAGMVQTWRNLDVDRLYEIEEGSEELRGAASHAGPRQSRSMGAAR